MDIGVVVLGAGAIVWSVPLLSDLTSLLTLFRRRSLTPPGRRAGYGRLAVVVPAHNEKDLITDCVQSLQAAQSSSTLSEIWVIADNCSDQTASRAASLGVSVLERFDAERPGKPAAIGWGLQFMPLARFDAVVIVDADTVVDRHFIDGLAQIGALTDIACQAWSDVANRGDSWLTRLASLFAEVRYSGQFRLKSSTGLNVPLTGDGMCLGTGLLARVGWQSATLAEDTELYVRLTLAGEHIEFALQSRLFAQESRNVAEASTQRRRWLAGRWQVLRNYFIPILRGSNVGFRQRLDLFAELLFPGPVVHASIGLTLSLFAYLIGYWWPIGVAYVVSLIPTVAWTAWGLVRRPDRLQLCVDLLRVPPYAVWRLFSGLMAIATVGSTRWERSPRSGPRAGSS